MKNIQCLTERGGLNKYILKYIVKIDEQNDVIMNTYDTRT